MPRTLLVLCLALVAAACGGGSADTTAPPEPSVLLATTADAMHATSGARFDLIRMGEPVFIDTGGLFEFNEAIGSYSPPAAAAVRIQASAFGLTTEVDAVSVDGDAWYTHPVTGAWERLPVTFGFDPVALFDPEDGWRPLLTQDLSDITMSEAEYDGNTVWKITGTTAPERLEVITAGLVADQAVEMTLFIDKATSHVLEASFTSQMGEGTTDWTLRLYDFGSEFDIQLPEAAQ
ncbi:MAG: LppX_LprAFG lipoprotein [Acidimicrobiia bacterium]|nr:LppX_LprAFG lipoprotein [Acidimicrobiia bacterium]